MLRIFTLLLLLPFGQTIQAQNYIGSKKQINKILENSRLFSTYVVASDYDKIADSYTTDGKIMPGGLDIITGREPIRKYWVLPEGMQVLSHKVTPVEIKIVGKEAIDHGYYEGTSKSPNGEISNWKGKYVIVWRREGKDWKMYLDIWNGIRE